MYRYIVSNDEEIECDVCEGWTSQINQMNEFEI